MVPRTILARAGRHLLIFVVMGWLLSGSTLALASPPDVPERYRAAVAAIDAFVAREVVEKKLPALSIALVDDQTIVWSQGYGFADAARLVPASADTVYRVGSVSKLFTDIAIMQLVEQGRIDLNAPAQKYLPDFSPKNTLDVPVTLRQMMAHRSGLIREPPLGSYFDPSSPSLAATVASLNGIDLVYRPGSRQKYSNAAIAAVGLALEKAEREPFAPLVARKVLAPLGMTRSGFEPSPALSKNLALATMWTYHGREFPAPTFELGIAPAGSLYSTVDDLGRFLSALFAGGRGRNGTILKPATLDAMLQVQFAREGRERGFGLGFSIGEFAGKRRIGHGGAVYGFATELAALPDQKLGAVVIASKDCANAVTTRIADVALGQLLAVREGRPLPAIETTAPLKPGDAKRWAGRYRSPNGSFDLIASGERLWMEPGQGGNRVEIRSLGNDLMGDDILDYGPRIVPDGDKLRLNRDVHDRVPVDLPPLPPPHFLGLIGEYGWDHDILYILEKDGRLQALIEWFFLYPLRQVSEDVYEFPDWGLYQGEKLVFRRDPSGRAREVEAASVVFKKRVIDGENGQTFRITPTRPIDEIRLAIQGAKPPVEPAKPRKPELVDLSMAVPGVKLDIRYASANNFLGTPLYTSATALIQRPAAEALARVQAKLAPRGLGLMIHDAYRPWRVTKLFREATPEAQHLFVADPAKGSRHNRGCAVDLTLCDLATGRAIAMPSGYDEFSDRAFPDYPGGTTRHRWYRDLLRKVMEEEGFTVNEAEWWHFDFIGWQDYPILDIPLEDLAPETRPK